MKVKTVFVKSAITIPGAMPSQTTLSSTRTKGLAMELVDQGVEVSVKGESAIVPWGNLNVIIFDKEKPAKSK